MRSWSQAGDIFALFCVSTSLTVQLKPHHQPFKILRKWPELLALFTSTGEPETEAPIMYLKRADMCHQGIERKYTQPRIVELLFQVRPSPCCPRVSLSSLPPSLVSLSFFESKSLFSVTSHRGAQTQD